MMKKTLILSFLAMGAASLASGQILAVHQFNFGNQVYEGTNSPGHADGLIPSSFDQWTTVNVTNIEFVDDQFVRFRRADGTGANAAVNLTQTSSTSFNRSSTTGTGVFDTELGQTWGSYVRDEGHGTREGRSVGAWFEGLPFGEYTVFAVVHNPVLIADGITTNVGIGVGSQTSGSLAWDDPSLTGTSFAASPQTNTWEEGVNYAMTTVTIDADNPILYVLQGGPAAQFDEFDYHTLTAIQLVQIPEPSTYAALFGLLAIGFVAWRRRRA